MMLWTLSILTLSLVPTPRGAQEGGPSEGHARVITDEGITLAVERELRHDPATDPDAIDVETSNGIVVLSGDAGSLLAKERSGTIAELVRGVRSVVNRIEVGVDPERTDAQILADVTQALLEDPATDSYEVTPEVHEGHVVLAGRVESWAEKRLCARTAKGVRGVRALSNDIEVRVQLERPDSEIRSEIVRTLDWDLLVDRDWIQVNVDGGAVTLTGTVGSAAARTRALTDCWTAGVRSVDAEGLRVEPWADDSELRGSSMTKRGDEEVRRALQEAFARDPRVLSFHVAPAVRSGVVTLRGVVDNLKARRAAVQDAHRTVGVVAVRDHLKVRPDEERADDAIAEDVRKALLRDPYVNRFDMTVRVDDGRVTLTGEVDSTFDKAHADDLASRVTGVTDVENSLVVELRPYGDSPYLDPWTIGDFEWYDLHPYYAKKSDLVLERDVEDELYWSPFVDADQVAVRSADGVVTLEGAVDSWMERGAAEDNAYDAGASYVRNHLQVLDGTGD